jgi:YbbR domain-containing protein
MMKRMMHNGLPKVVSAALALIAWYVISLNVATTSQRNLKIPVSVVGLEQTQMISETIDEVEIAVSGDSRQVDRLVPENFTATLNVTGLSGEYTQTIEVIPPQGINVDNVSPEISIGTIETISSKSVPVMVAFISGQDVDSRLEIVPIQDTVRVQGRESVLVQITQVVALVDARVGETTIPVYATDENGTPITTSEVSLEPSSIRVNVIAEPILHTKAVSIMVEPPLTEGFEITNFNLSQSVITLTGNHEALESLEQVSGKVIVLDTFEAQSYALPVELELPANVNALQTITAEFVLEPINPLSEPDQ